MPQVEITSPGIHAGDPTPPPQFAQGQKYTVTAVYSNIPQDPEGPVVDWVPIKDVWTYPTGVVKGYGKFLTQNSDPDGPHTTFVSVADEAENTKVEVQGFTTDDVDKLHVSADHFIPSFYFGPNTRGDQTISVTTTFVKHVNGNNTNEQATASDSVTINVVEPTGTIEILETGVAGISGIQSNGNYLLQFDKDRERPPLPNLVEAPKPGIKWRTHVDPPLTRDGTSFGGVFMSL